MKLLERNAIRDSSCIGCKLSQTCKTVCMDGRGDKHAEIMIIGESPGTKEDNRGVPFVGSSGRFLIDSLAEVGISEWDCYMTTAVSCHPPEGRAPSKSEIKACSKWLQARIKAVKPRYVLLLGNTPLLSVLGVTGIRRKRGKPIQKDGVIYLPAYSPSYVLYDRSNEGVFKKDLETLKTLVEFGGIPEEEELRYTIVDNDSRVEAMLKDLSGTVSSDLETSCLYPWANQAKIVSIGFGTKRNQWILPGETAGIWTKKQLTRIVDRITDKLDECLLVGHNWKFDALWMRVRFGVEWTASFDTMLAHYLLDENDLHGLKHLAQKYLGAPDWEIEVVDKQKWSIKTAKYHAHDLYYTRALRFYLGKKLNKEPGVKLVFQKIMMPCVELFTDAEFYGVYVDQSKMNEAEVYLRGERDKALKELNSYTKGINLDKKKGGVNWRSPQQVGVLLYDHFKLEVLDRTKTGGRSVSESVIQRTDHPLAGALLRYREADKQLSSFIEGWKPFIVNSRLHPSFKLHGTVTGRLSCENPNLQQVPRDPRIRSLITAAPGRTLIEVDLSQIELRIAAELAHERNMLQAFQNGVDVHWLTAISEIARGGGLVNEVMKTAKSYVKLSKGTVKYIKKAGINPDKINYGDAIQVMLEMGPDTATEILSDWKELRKKAKAVNFGYLYGMWWKKFKLYARDNYGVTVTDKQAQESRKAFFSNYPEFEDWHKRQRAFAREEGFVLSLSGRKRRLPAAMLPESTSERKEAERQAINSPVQSFANELNLMAALQLREEFPRSAMRIVGTVHDAILIDCRNDWVERVASRTLEIMRGPKLLKTFDIDLRVPIEGEEKIGAWSMGKSLEKWKMAA